MKRERERENRERKKKKVVERVESIGRGRSSRRE